MNFMIVASFGAYGPFLATIMRQTTRRAVRTG